MTVCSCKCHQNTKLISSCTRCANTGIELAEIPMDKAQIKFEPVAQKPLYKEGTTEKEIQDKTYTL